MSEVTFKTIWDALSQIDVEKEGLTKKKKGDGQDKYSYVPWAIAWEKVIGIYPESYFEIMYNENGFPCFYEDGIGGFCRTAITIHGHTRSMDLPVLNFSNKTMKKEQYTYTVNRYENGQKSGTIEKTVNAIDSFEVNTTKWRCLVKNLSMFGFGIKLFANHDWNNQSDIDVVNNEPWEIQRDKPIGRGKNADTPWSKLAGNSLTFYIDKEKNKFYSEWYAIRAQKEIDWRSGQMEVKDFDDLNPKDEHVTKDIALEYLREDVQADADNVLKNKYGKEIKYDYYCDSITEAKTKEELTTVKARIMIIDELIKAWDRELLDITKYKTIFARINIGNNDELDNILSEIHLLDKDSKEGSKMCKHYCGLIEELHKTLGYHEKKSINSMRKHLDNEDMFAIKDWSLLKEYHTYLQNKLGNELDSHDDINEKEVAEPKNTLVNPNHKKDIGIG